MAGVGVGGRGSIHTSGGQWSVEEGRAAGEGRRAALGWREDGGAGRARKTKQAGRGGRNKTKLSLQHTSNYSHISLWTEERIPSEITFTSTSLEKTRAQMPSKEFLC